MSWKPETKVKKKAPLSLKEKLVNVQRSAFELQETNNTLREINEQQQAEVARLTQELEAARELLVEVDNQFTAEDFGKFGADVLDKVSAFVNHAPTEED